VILLRARCVAYNAQCKRFFKQIEEAILTGKDVSFEYQKRGVTSPTLYHAKPLGLFLNGSSFYLVATKTTAIIAMLKFVASLLICFNQQVAAFASTMIFN
jgi:hypothetical protein